MIIRQWVSNRVAAGKGRVFSRAIAIDQSAARIAVQDFAHMRLGQNIPASQELSHGGEAFQMIFHHLVKKSGGEPESCDFFADDQTGQFRETGSAGWMNDQFASIQQTAPNFESGGIK